jgi:hypothetical protein
MNEKELVKYFRSLGLAVNTRTKARGHHGFYMKNRIDVSRNTPPERVVPTLLHEFAHYIHHKIEPDMHRTGGTFEALFQSDNPVIASELMRVTNFVDENSLCRRHCEHKERVKSQIKKQEAIIKADFPAFQRSKKFKEFDKYIRRSDARYLLQYDRVRILSGFFSQRVEVFTLDGLEKDFPGMPRAFAAYIRLKSAQRKQARISARINKLQKYYQKPSELFARLVEGLYLDNARIRELAPYTTWQFYELLNKDYYCELKNCVKG